LLRAAVAGDHSALNGLYARHRGAVIGRLSHLCGPCVDLDDLVQETFLSAFRALGSYRGDAPFRAWLLGIATHAARSHHRRARRSIWRLFFANDEEHSLSASVRAEADAYPELAAVHAALGRLPARLREAVILFELEGRTLVEIATEQGIPINTVAARVRRGRVALRTELSRMGCTEGDAMLAPCPGENS
jgi:RNA polymerase sigma-70 factor (ECF subfamily)